MKINCTVVLNSLTISPDYFKVESEKFITKFRMLNLRKKSSVLLF